MDEVAELAERWGIEREFFDARGQLQRADPETVRRIASALAVSGDPHPFGDAGAALQCAYQGNGESRVWVLALQLYAIRSNTNWGHGDLTDLAALVRLASQIGAAGIGLNPLHALFPDRPVQASPYAPNSRLFLNALYIDVMAAPGFPGLAGLDLAEEVRRLQAAQMVDYAGVGRTKMRALRAAYAGFRKRPALSSDFEAFRRDRGAALEQFAAFETLRSVFCDVAWWDWPQEWRQPTEVALRSLRETAAEEMGFQEYVQWVADRQLQQCHALARSLGLRIGLYMDMAVGVEPGGADAWAGQGALLRGLSIGAPPDPLNTAGQEWGITTYDPHRLAARDFAPFREMLRFGMRHAGAVRLDHILGLKRLYVVPRGASAVQGTYLRYPLESLLAVVAEESQRNHCVVIGEALGTVPEGFREQLAAWGIWTYVVMLFERERDSSFRSPDRYPVNALATFSTHDLATFAGWLSGHDLRIKRSIGFDPGERDEERASAIAALHETRRRHGFEGDGFTPVARYLSATPSRLVVVSIEDALMIEDQVNVPGTIYEHPNWRQRLPLTIDELERDERLHQIAKVFAESGRANSGA
jgi:4-alpha-glucanotransferase